MKWRPLWEIFILFSSHTVLGLYLDSKRRGMLRRKVRCQAFFFVCFVFCHVNCAMWAGKRGIWELWDHSRDASCGVIHSRVRLAQGPGSSSNKDKELQVQTKRLLFFITFFFFLNVFYLFFFPSVFGCPNPACVLLGFYTYSAIKQVEMMQGRLDDRRFTISAKYYKRTATWHHFLYSPSRFSVRDTFPPCHLPNAESQMVVGEMWIIVTFSSVCCVLSYISSEFLSLNFHLTEQEVEWRVRWWVNTALPCTRPTPVGWLEETGWLEGCGAVDGGILVEVVGVV